MKIKRNKIIEATENELFQVYLDKGYDDLFPFDLFLSRCKELGTKIIDEENEER